MQPQPRNIVMLMLAVLPVALAGCTDAAKLSAEAVLEYDGSSSGSHSETADCGDEATITGDGTIRDGSVTLTIIDGSDDQAYQQTWEEDFTLQPKTVAGASGEWRMEADRAGDDLVGDDFSGEYTFTLTC